MRYHNLWWFKEEERMVDSSMQFWIYWKALQAAAVKVSQLSEEVVTNFQRIAQFAIGPHAIHVQERCDP